MNEQELSNLQARLERFKIFLKEDADNPDLLIDCGHISHRIGQFDSAREFLDRALKIRPDDQRALDERGKLALSENDVASAVSLFRHSLEVRRTPASLTNLGIALDHMECWEEAAACLSEARQQGSDSPQLFRYLAVAEHHRGEFELAISAGQRWNELAHDAASAGYLSLIHLDFEQWDEAERLARKALAIDPGQEDANIVLGNIALNALDIAEASNRYAAAAHSPDNGRAQLGLGLSHLCRQEPEAAEQCLQRAVEAMPDYVTGWVTLGWVKVGLGRYDDARDVFEKAVTCDRTFAEAQGGLAAAYALLGKIDEAQQREKVASKLDPENFGSIFTRSLLAGMRGNPTEGQRYILDGLARPVMPGMPSLQDLARKLIAKREHRPRC